MISGPEICFVAAGIEYFPDFKLKAGIPARPSGCPCSISASLLNTLRGNNFRRRAVSPVFSPPSTSDSIILESRIEPGHSIVCFAYPVIVVCFGALGLFCPHFGYLDTKKKNKLRRICDGENSYFLK